jgi:hypothetical protein
MRRIGLDENKNTNHRDLLKVNEPTKKKRAANQITGI